MNLNYSTQNQGLVAWDGTAAAAIDIRHHAHFSFTFQVTADLVANASFKVQSAPPDAVDPCIPGAFVEIPEVLTCIAPWGTNGAATSSLVIPSGTKAGSICTATLPCKPDAFVKLVATGGATVKAVAVLSGPR